MDVVSVILRTHAVVVVFDDADVIVDAETMSPTQVRSTRQVTERTSFSKRRTEVLFDVNLPLGGRR